MKKTLPPHFLSSALDYGLLHNVQQIPRNPSLHGKDNVRNPQPQLFHLEALALRGQSLKIVKLRACNQCLATVTGTCCGLL